MNSPSELYHRLVTIFPDYTFERTASDLEEYNYHALLLDFLQYFGVNHPRFSEKQLKKFGDVVNNAVAAGGEIENAFGTCFLEHLGYSFGRKALAPFLSKLAKNRA